MNFIKVDNAKCNRDGICRDVCPARLIEIKSENTMPTPVEDAASRCIRCGHCVAACPTGALIHAEIALEQCPPIRPQWRLDSDHAEHFLRSRRSIRAYRDQPVPQKTLTKLIHIARYAPSGHNRQPVQWRVAYERQKVHQFAGHAADWLRHVAKSQPQSPLTAYLGQIAEAWDHGVDLICRDAPHLIIAHAMEKDLTAPSACTIALTYLDLAAPTLGLGACWAGYFTSAAQSWPPLKKILDLPVGHVCFGAMMIGIPKYRYYRLVPRKAPVITWD